MQLFKEVNREGRTVLMVTHEEDIARQTQRVIQMRDGVVISDEAACAESG